MRASDGISSAMIALILFIGVTASAHALLEIQIEGASGWAEKLPTRRFSSRLVRRFAEVGYVTGFHIATGAFVVALAHFPVLFAEHWTWLNEGVVIAYILLHFTVEDFLWFVYNPAYGIQKFKKRHIWWHKHWFACLPISYWISVPIAIILLALSIR